MVSSFFFLGFLSRWCKKVLWQQRGCCSRIPEGHHFTPPSHFTLCWATIFLKTITPQTWEISLWSCGKAHVLDHLHQAMTSHTSHIFRVFGPSVFPWRHVTKRCERSEKPRGPRLPSSDGPRLRRATSSVSSSWPRRMTQVDSGVKKIHGFIMDSSSFVLKKDSTYFHIPKWSSHFLKGTS